MFKIGQKLFRVNTHFNRDADKESWVTIEKIGHKWLTVACKYGRTERVCKEDLRVDGGIYSSPAQCYLEQQDYIDKKTKSNIWRKIENKYRFGKVADISVEDMKTIAKILDIQI